MICQWERERERERERLCHQNIFSRCIALCQCQSTCKWSVKSSRSTEYLRNSDSHILFVTLIQISSYLIVFFYSCFHKGTDNFTWRHSNEGSERLRNLDPGVSRTAHLGDHRLDGTDTKQHNGHQGSSGALWWKLWYVFSGSSRGTVSLYCPILTHVIENINEQHPPPNTNTLIFFIWTQHFIQKRGN